MASSLVLGVNGQDGSYLAEVLLARGDQVIGVARQAESRWVDPAHFRYVPLDAGDESALDALLAETMPDRIFHMAAVHGSSGHTYETTWRQALNVNVGAVHTCLEHLRRRAPAARLFYPSSLKVFGDPPPAVIDEQTPLVSSCLYSITKNAATELIRQYRARHGVWACVGYDFNHDSPRRPDSYFLPRLVAQLVGAARGEPDAPRVATLDFWCDWGSAQEFMEITADLISLDRPRDVVIATGRPVYAADLAAQLADEIGAPPPPSTPRRAPVAAPFNARLDELRHIRGHAPKHGALDVARWILAERYGIGSPAIGRP